MIDARMIVCAYCMGNIEIVIEPSGQKARNGLPLFVADHASASGHAPAKAMCSKDVARQFDDLVERLRGEA
jgi:hypothetical protein